MEKLARNVALTPLPILRFIKIALTRAYEAMGLRDAVKSNLDVAAVLNSAHSDERQKFTRLVTAQCLSAVLTWRDGRYAAVDDYDRELCCPGHDRGQCPAGRGLVSTAGTVAAVSTVHPVGMSVRQR